MLSFSSLLFFFFFLGLLCDLLWSDPDKDVQGWGENDRGVSFTFGADVVSKFLNRHDLDLICRAHQVSEDPHESRSIAGGSEEPKARHFTKREEAVNFFMRIVKARLLWFLYFGSSISFILFF